MRACMPKKAATWTNRELKERILSISTRVRWVPEKIRAHVYVSGLVQGVYFRQNTKDVASRHSVMGWVHNLADGRVEAVFEGDESSVRKVVKWCRTGPQNAKVEAVNVTYGAYSGEFQDFKVTY